MFDQFYDAFTALFRGEATIDLNGNVTHDPGCLCESSLLTTQIMCTCKVDDERDPEETEYCDPLALLKTAFELARKNELQQIFIRESFIFRYPPKIDFEQIIKRKERLTLCRCTCVTLFRH